MTAAFKLEQLEDWELHGAEWRALALDDRRVVLELCTCSGEPVDRVESEDPDLIEYVRHHGESDI